MFRNYWQKITITASYVSLLIPTQNAIDTAYFPQVHFLI